MATLTETDRATVRRMIERDWVAASLARDLDTCLAMCSKDVVYMPQDHPTVTGIDDLRTFLDAFPPVTRFEQELQAVDGTTDLAVLRATADFAMDVEGKEVSGTGKFIATLEKHGDDWLFTTVCYNWDAPLDNS